MWCQSKVDFVQIIKHLLCVVFNTRKGKSLRQKIVPKHGVPLKLLYPEICCKISALILVIFCGIYFTFVHCASSLVKSTICITNCFPRLYILKYTFNNFTYGFHPYVTSWCSLTKKTYLSSSVTPHLLNLNDLWS